MFGPTTGGWYPSASASADSERAPILRWYADRVEPGFADYRVYGYTVRCLQVFTLAFLWENGTRNTENAFCRRGFNLVPRVPFSDLLVTARRAPAGYYPVMGFRSATSGGSSRVGTQGYFWPSGVVSTAPFESVAMLFTDSSIAPYLSADRANGFPVRCLQVFTSHSDTPRKRKAAHWAAFFYFAALLPKYFSLMRAFLPVRLRR